MSIFIFALVTSFLLTYIPSLITTFLIGSLFLGINKISFITFLIIFVIQIMAILTMVGIASLIGWKSSSPEIANAIGNITFTFFITMSPVLIPDNRVPNILNKLSYLMPTTYAVKSINMVMNNLYNKELYIYIIVLIILSILSCILLKKVLD